MKRFFIIASLLFGLLASVLAGFYYFFDINDYSQWIARQIEASTGYQVSFVLSKKNDGWPRDFVITDLSVALDTEKLLHIDKINFFISDLDFWRRRLELGLLELQGVQLAVDKNALQQLASAPEQAIAGAEKPRPQKQTLPWSQLRVGKLRIADLNAQFSNAQQQYSLQQGNLRIDDLTIIEHNRLAAALLKGDVQLNFKALVLQPSSSQTVRFNDLSLDSHFDLANLQASLAVAVKRFAVSLPNQAEVVVDNSWLDIQLNKNKLSVTRASADAFSGRLALQAEAFFTAGLSPGALFSVDKVAILSLLAEDMHLKIPAFLKASTDGQSNRITQKQELPLRTLYLQQIDLQNLTISSEEKQLPIMVEGLNCQVQDLYLLENNRLADLSAESNQNSLFSLQFAHLQWAETVVEQFAMAGSFAENAERLLLLNQLLIDK